MKIQNILLILDENAGVILIVDRNAGTVFLSTIKMQAWYFDQQSKRKPSILIVNQNTSPVF